MDINETLNATNVALSKAVATEVVTRLESLVEKHNQLNERLMNLLTTKSSGITVENPREEPPLGYPRTSTVMGTNVHPPF